MKYHDHYIIPKREDLGYEENSMNRVYDVYDGDGNFLTQCWTLNNAKDYVDSGHDETVLC